MNTVSHTWTINEIRGSLEFSELESAWNELLSRQPEGTIFWSYDYLRAWREAFGQSQKWRVLVVKDGQDVQGIFPLVCSTKSYYGVSINQLGFFQNHHILRSNALMRPGSEENCLEAVISHLALQPKDWSVLLLDNIPETSAMYSLAIKAASNLGCNFSEWKPSRNHRFLPITGTWDEYLSQRSGNFRWQIKKFQRRLQQLGEIRIERLTDRERMLEALPDIFALEQKSWQGQESGSTMQDNDRLFQELLLRYLPDENLGEYWLLYINDELSASITTLHHRDLMYIFTTYYAPEYSSAAPGMVLYFEMLKTAWNSQLKGVDFNGDSHAFRRWTPISRPHFRLHIYSNTYTGRLIRFSKRLRDHVREKIA